MDHGGQKNKIDTDLRDGRCRVVGTKQLLKLLAVDGVSTLYIAGDAQEHIKEKLLPLARQHGVPVVQVDSMDELGRMCGIAVGSAAAGLLREVR